MFRKYRKISGIELVPNKLQGGQQGGVGKHRVNINSKMYERGIIFAYFLSYDESLMKTKLRHSYTELMENYPMFLWPRLNVIKLKDIGNINLNIPGPEFIAYPTHQIKAVHKSIFTLRVIPRRIN